MKKSNIALTTLLTASIFIHAGMAKANIQSDRQEILQKLDWMSKGCNSGNIKQCYAYCANDFQEIQVDGKVIVLKESIKNIKQFYQQVSKYRFREEVIRVNVDGNLAGVVGVAYSESIIGNKRIYRQTPYEDLWEKTNKGWLLISRSWYQGNDNEVAIGR
ncbi:unknown protein [Nostoc sp. NIES-3756]|uniref:nuclear transport factor 2 family protein n=1 Tax=Nostoc sp. NIES-3756 TaxID=1751286 RepID=UPI00071EA67F|nr:nuclear transport factor 2 family protein [Nostoc sp. NIES-3756]BAT54046.1 unknown protein [Nostoc sp. NIES-3756]